MSPDRLRRRRARWLQALGLAGAPAIAEAGVDAPVREIAERAGVGVATLYRHFPQRSDLIVAVFRNEVDACARAAAELCGPTGPMVAPLPGGTMNMLPHAVYGNRPWQEALRLALTEGRERDIGGGCIEGHRFLVAAILGALMAFLVIGLVGSAFDYPRISLLFLLLVFAGMLRFCAGLGRRRDRTSL